MPRITPWTAAAVLLWVIAFTVRVEENRLAREREHTGAALLSASNLAAQRDSTRHVAQVNARVASLLGDSLTLVEKRAQQVAQHADALDRSLGRERLARYAAVASIDSLERIARAPIDTTTDDNLRTVRVASFNLRRAPYTIAAEIVVPPPPDSAQIQLDIALDPIPIEARVSCAPPDAGGIREATVNVSTPKWAEVHLGTVEQSPSVCASPVLYPHRPRRSILGLHRFVVGAGPSYGTDGRWRWAVFVGTGFSLFG